MQKNDEKKDGKQYATDHSYFLTEGADSTIILDEDMAVNASERKKRETKDM